jgi:hypothetical protein
MRIETWADLERVVHSRATEVASLEFKREVDLAGEGKRREALKDLTGMGNGGGGTIVYGLAEDPAREGVAGELTPLDDPGIAGALEDIVRSGVRPPLVVEFRQVRNGDEVVVVADVERSPLGPYMIESYGVHRYYKRHGTRTLPMTEQEVRDAYVIAARARDRREELWQELALPPNPLTDGPWLIASGLPEEPLADIFDPGASHPNTFRPDELLTGMRTYAEDADISGATNQIGIWADGIHGDDSYDERTARSFFRLHRDGAVTHASEFHTRISTWTVPRALNGQLAFIAWLWEKIELRNLAEVDVRLEHLDSATIDSPHWSTDQIEAKQPVSAPPPAIRLRRQLVPNALTRASVRHSLVREFADRLEAAFGRTGAKAMFTLGWLYGRSGFLELSVAGGGIYDRQANRRGSVDQAGVITGSKPEPVGFLKDGVILDSDGNAMAALEMATGAGLPDDFRLQAVVTSPLPVIPHGQIVPAAEASPVDHPAPSGEWSVKSLGAEL